MNMRRPSSKRGMLSVCCKRAAAAGELHCSAEDTREYPWRIKMLSLGSTLLILYTFATVLYTTYLGWTAFLSLFGPWKVRTLDLARLHAVFIARQGKGDAVAHGQGICCWLKVGRNSSSA